MADSKLPQDKRYFYTDPLAAMWMAKKFGMRYCVPNGSSQTLRNLLCDPRFKWEAGVIIHHDSLHLLEPRVGDVMGGFALLEIASDMCLNMLKQHKLDGNEFIIIQRNGIPFMWPGVG